jgi:aminoglycoside 6'-N-acetyltransferase
LAVRDNGPVTDPVITFRPVTQDDFALLGRWLAEPHVARWWNHDSSPQGVEADFGPTLRGEQASQDLLALLDGHPVGLIQRSRLDGYPEYLADYEAIVPVPAGAVVLDYLLGDPAQIGRGLGPIVIRSAVAQTWLDLPEVPCILVAVVVANTRSWRALEKAGLVRAGTGEMEPDNPVDDPAHYIYRVDRPQESTAS